MQTSSQIHRPAISIILSVCSFFEQTFSHKMNTLFPRIQALHISELCLIISHGLLRFIKLVAF